MSAASLRRTGDPVAGEEPPSQRADERPRAAGGTGDEYARLPADRITGPPGLSHTDCDPNRPQVKAHWHGRSRPALLMTGLTAAGAVPSSARDLLRLGGPARPRRRTGRFPAHRLMEVRRPRLVSGPVLAALTNSAPTPLTPSCRPRTWPWAHWAGGPRTQMDRSGVKHDRLRRFTVMVLPRCVTGLTFSSYAPCLRA
ncbi:serine hydrolase [Streptomyces sp. NPDC057428]|uniref:serine hydrolase n=1 Tax=Streptomyces sp. NPDC057428 TaxID=3346129 RepID=UPI0036CF7F2F